MGFNPEFHHRRSIRLKDYDYSQKGACFVTICTGNRRCLFGNICDGKLSTNDAGKMIQQVWDQLPFYYNGINIDQFQIMPNHIHGIIVITDSVGAGPRACPDPGQPQGVVRSNPGQPQGVAPTMSLPNAIHRFKTMTTKQYTDGVKQNGWQPFPGKLWQRNYYEHVIRDDNELNRIREYIMTNPLNWNSDKYNPLQNNLNVFNQGGTPWKETS
jgi:putative transposase